MSTVISWRRTTAEQALFYVDHKQELVDKYAGRYILLQDGEVRWNSDVSDLQQSRRKLAGDRKEQALWLKYVDPDEDRGRALFGLPSHAGAGRGIAYGCRPLTLVVNHHFPCAKNYSPVLME